MCGRYGLVESKELPERFQASGNVDGLVPRYNVAPTQTLPVITRHSPNTIEMMRWGLIPYWAKDPKIAYSTINARMEGVADKPAYRTSFKNKRCLVPGSFFYEFKPEGKEKRPFLFKLTDTDLFAFAGLYDKWRSPEGDEVLSYSIITTEANDVVSPIHPRMPVILKKEDEDTWLDPDNHDTDLLLHLLTENANGNLETFQVSTAVNSPRNDSADIIKPV